MRLRRTEINGLESEPALQEQNVSLDPTLEFFQENLPENHWGSARSCSGNIWGRGQTIAAVLCGSNVPETNRGGAR